MDYMGEVGIGAWEYKKHVGSFDHGAGWMTAGSGRLDITGKANAEMLYMRVAYGIDKIGLAAKAADTAFDKHSPSAWKMSNALRSWSFNGFEGNKTIVEVYAKAHSAKLFLNGKQIGKKKLKACVARFKVTYQTGELIAVAFDKNGKETARTHLKSAGKATTLKAIPESKKVSLQDGLCYVRFKITDLDGTTKPLEKTEIKLSVKNGTLLGFGNGCSFNRRGYTTNTNETYHGEALAVIKPLKAGKIIITATSSYGTCVAESEAE